MDSSPRRRAPRRIVRARVGDDSRFSRAARTASSSTGYCVRASRHAIIPAMRRWMVLGVLTVTTVTAAATVGGCSDNLVTGYQPRKLGDSPAARRAYYAGKFTPEARAAEAERAEELKSRRPTPAAGGSPAGPRGD